MRLREPEVIGHEDCPILHRWTLVGTPLAPPRGPVGRKTLWPSSQAQIKLMVHHFLPHADDRDLHDHPRPFITLVLKGSYDDLGPCPWCKDQDPEERERGWCHLCLNRQIVLRERMKAGMVRRRRAGHLHRTRVGKDGCWTIVLMGPLRRKWGFVRDGKWISFAEYTRKFGSGMRCD